MNGINLNADKDSTNVKKADSTIIIEKTDSISNNYDKMKSKLDSLMNKKK